MKFITALLAFAATSYAVSLSLEEQQGYGFCRSLPEEIRSDCTDAMDAAMATSDCLQARNQTFRDSRGRCDNARFPKACMQMRRTEAKQAALECVAASGAVEGFAEWRAAHPIPTPPGK